MANEGRITATLQAVKGNLKVQVPPIQFQFDLATAKICAGSQTIDSASETVIDFGDLTTLGYAAFHNLDAANPVTIGPESGAAMVDAITLLPGQWAIFPMAAGSVWRGQATTADVELEKWILAL